MIGLARPKPWERHLHDGLVDVPLLADSKDDGAFFVKTVKQTSTDTTYYQTTLMRGATPV
ncbi:hypothetical protein ASD03_26820 [Ensifer sp. Root127]|nr:hypothetical protein ASD03_26820 [Ensifer sp. Root127]